MDDMFDPAVFRVEGVAAHVPRFPLLVDDLAALSDDALRARTLDAVVGLVLVMLRDGRHPERLLANFTTWRDAIRHLVSSPHGSDMLRSLLIYIATVSDLHFEQIRATIHEHLPEAEPTAVTTARQLIQQGLEQGLETGRKQTVLRMLALKFGPLDEASTQRVELASAQELDQLLERALQAATLSDALQP